MSGEFSNFASYDLIKNRKTNENKESQFRAVSFYKQANDFYYSSKFLFDAGKLDYMNVILTNTAFACELYMKALLYHFNITFNSTHGLKDLFEKLEDLEKDFISKNIFNNSPHKDNFEMCLNEQNEAFKQYRYSCEVNRLVGDFNFLFCFAKILEYVCSKNIKLS